MALDRSKANYRPVDYPHPREGQCAAMVWKADTYRRTGRGSSGFEMHYNRCQCSRKPTKGRYCWQHHYED